MTPQQENLAPCPFCGGPARHLERNPGFYDERAICDPCNYSLSPAAWNRRAPAPTQPAVDRDAVLEEVAEHVESLIDSIGDAAAYDNREMHDDEIMKMHYNTTVANSIRSLKHAIPASTAIPAGMVLVPDYRGYANLGTGQYILNHSRKSEPAELVISIATDEQKKGRTVGDLKPTLADSLIQPDVMAVRLRFSTVAGLDALELQLAMLRAVHFPVPKAAELSGNTGELPQVAQASQPTSAEGMTAWAAYCPAGFQFIHADQRVVEDFVYTRRYCGEGPYSIMHMKVSRPTSAEGKDSERLDTDKEATK